MNDFAQEVQAMQYRYQGMLDRPQEPIAGTINRHFDNLKFSVQQEKDGATIHGHLKELKRDVHMAAGDKIINYGEAAELKAWIDHSMKSFS